MGSKYSSIFSALAAVALKALLIMIAMQSTDALTERQGGNVVGIVRRFSNNHVWSLTGACLCFFRKFKVVDHSKVI
jgi:predicted MFS family arabinose efflux permease